MSWWYKVDDNLPMSLVPQYYGMPAPTTKKKKNKEMSYIRQVDELITGHQRLAEWLKTLKDDGKKEEKKKDEPKPRTFTFLEVFGMVCLFGPVATIAYLALLKKILDMLPGFIQSMPH